MEERHQSGFSSLSDVRYYVQTLINTREVCLSVWHTVHMRYWRRKQSSALPFVAVQYLYRYKYYKYYKYCT